MANTIDKNNTNNVDWADGPSGGTPVTAENLNKASNFIIDQINNRILDGGDPTPETALIVKQAKNATTAVTAMNAMNVATSIDGVDLANIFESNGTTVKQATNAQTAGSATNAVTAANATDLKNGLLAFLKVLVTQLTDEAVAIEVTKGKTVLQSLEVKEINIIP